MNTVSIWDYANRGTNAKGVSIGDIDLYFSYKTIIAYRSPKTGLVIRKNDWSTTTGGHLNSISEDKSIRITGEDFEKKLNETLAGYGLTA